ncbi:hypothetical protein CVV73_25390, partial [Enterobacter hormaechei]
FFDFDFFDFDFFDFDFFDFDSFDFDCFLNQSLCLNLSEVLDLASVNVTNDPIYTICLNLGWIEHSSHNQSIQVD